MENSMLKFKNPIIVKSLIGIFLLINTIFMGLYFLSPKQDTITADSIRTILKEDPKIVLDVIRNNPLELQKILVAGQKKAYEETIGKIRADELKSPKSPVIGKHLQPLPGSTQNAPVTIVIYSNFQCPNCAQATKTVEKLMKVYPGKLKVYYKHTTGSSNLAFQQALAFEATLKQSPAKAWLLHDYMYENMATIRADGLSAILPFAQKIKIDLNQYSQDMSSQVVLDRLRSDHEENLLFKIKYTPTVMINGISVIGTQPLKEYTDVIDSALKAEGV